jgi:hypothetical protein
VDRLGEAETQMDLWEVGEVGEVGKAGGREGGRYDATPGFPPSRHPATDRESFRALQGAVDKIRKRWGERGVRVGK